MANQQAEQLLDETIMAMEKFGWAFSDYPFPVVVHSEGEVCSFENIAKRPLAELRSNKLSNRLVTHRGRCCLLIVMRRGPFRALTGGGDPTRTHAGAHERRARMPTGMRWWQLAS